MTLAPVLVGCAAMFVIIEFGPTLLLAWTDMTWAAITATGVMLVVAVVLERAFFGRTPRTALAALGFGAPAIPALAIAGLVVLPMLAFFPAFTAITGAAFSPKPDWWWIVVGSIALNGIAEETLFRGYTFGGLRRAGFTFRDAGLVSLAVFAAVHLFLFAGNPPIVAVLAVIVAIATAFPLAFLFEAGRNTIWAPALLHVGTHTIRFVDITEAHYQAAVTAWVAMQIVVPLLVFAFWRRLRPAA